MQIEECYRLMGADYDDVLNRMMTNQRVYKFNKKFSENSDYKNLIESLSQNDFETAPYLFGIIPELPPWIPGTAR